MPLRADDHERFMRLFLAHEPEVLRSVLVFVPHRADARDIVQDTAVALWRHFADYDDARPFVNWACGFARMEVRRYLRRAHRRAAFDGARTPRRLRTGEALSVEAGAAPVVVRIEPGGGTAEFHFATIEPPSDRDYADRSRGAARIEVVQGGLFLTAPIPSGAPELLLDGRGQTAPDSRAESVFFDKNAPGALLLDLGRVISVEKINTYSWHQNRAAENRVRAVQKFTLYGYSGDSPPPITDAPNEAGWISVARVDSDHVFRVMAPIDRPAQQACSITGARGAIGRYRYLLWIVEPTVALNRSALDNTFYAEFDVYGEP